MIETEKRRSVPRRLAFFAAQLALFSSLADATSISFKPLVCGILLQVYDAVRTAGASLVVIMFIYGGVKYAFAADDPTGRKSGKMTCIHSLIGGMLIVLFEIIRAIVLSTWWGTCP